MEAFESRVSKIVSELSYKEGYKLICAWDKTFGTRLYLQVQCWRPDAVTGEMGHGYGGKAYLTEFMKDNEIIQLALGLFLRYEEHECREFFKWKGKAIYGPHIDPEALYEIADRVTYREET